MLTTKEIAKVWNVSAIRVRQLIKEGRVEGAVKIGRDWLIPKDASYPTYTRVWFKKRTSRT